MGVFDLDGVRKASPDPKLFVSAVTASEARNLKLHERTVIIESVAAGVTYTLELPPPGMAEGDVFSVRLGAGSGRVVVSFNQGATTYGFAANTSAETMTFFSDGYIYRVIEDNAS